jgi:tetratricopeptide (TPR) repeat protein
MAHRNNIQLAVELNNQAAALIGNGQFEYSIPALTSALKASKNEIIDFADEQDQQNGAPIKQTSLDECMLAKQSSVQDEQEELSGDDGVDQGCYVYNRPIHIPASSIEETSSTYHSSVMVSVVAIFNLALAHHLTAMEENKVNLLRKAAKLYELAHNMQREEEWMGNTSLFTMAIINNLGMIYRCLDESETSGKCFQQLLSTLMFFTDCGGLEENQRDVLPAFAGFFRNTSNLIFHCSSAAAAA